MLLAGGEHPAMSKGIRADMQRFMEAYESDPVDPKPFKHSCRYRSSTLALARGAGGLCERSSIARYL